MAARRTSLPLVALLTDFGLRDSYVAEMKATLVRLSPKVQLLDITHEVPAFDIEAGAFHLLRSFPAFPKGSVFLAVVDPGVGTSRRAIAIEAGHYRFVGPDNGLLRWAAEAAARAGGKPLRLGEIPVAAGTWPTFHGRDVFAPFVARWLSGKAPKLRAGELSGRPFPAARRMRGSWQGEILVADHYGNLVTSVAVADCPDPKVAQVEGNPAVIEPAPNYQSIAEGRAALIRGSHGFWEIACREASAAARLRVKRGAAVAVGISVLI